MAIAADPELRSDDHVQACTRTWSSGSLPPPSIGAAVGDGALEFSLDFAARMRDGQQEVTQDPTLLQRD